MLVALALAAALAPAASGAGGRVAGALSGLFPGAPCCEFRGTPPDEAGTDPSDEVLDQL